MNEQSTEARAATRNDGAGITRKLAVALLAALAVVAFQLARAQAGSAATGVPCLQTGLETISTNRDDYAPGAIVHLSGAGFAPACDVVVQVTRPDGLVVVGDGSDTPGSDTVSTDLFGNLTYDYQLDSFPPVIGTYVIDVLGVGGSVVAHMTFTDANNDANIAPEWAAGNTVTT